MIFSRHPRRPAPLRHVTRIPSPQLLYFPHLQNRDARNSFRIRSYENCRVSPSPLNFPTSKPSNLPTVFIYPLSFHVFAHSLAQRALRNSFGINLLRTLSHATEGVPPRFSTEAQMNCSMANFSGSNPSVRCSQHRSARKHSLPRSRFASPPHKYLVNCLHPILQSVGPAGHFQDSASGPRSEV